MIKNICILFLFIFYNFFTTNIAFKNQYIQASVNNEIITNHDIKKEGKYLKILNPQLNSLENEQISELAKQSLIKEIIKKNEILKFVDLNEQNDFADEYLKQFLLKLGFENEDDFKKELKKDNTYTFEEVKLKNKIEVYWNEIIISKYSNKININEKKLQKKINKYSKKKKKKKYFLSEIVFRKKKNENLENIINKIKKVLMKLVLIIPQIFTVYQKVLKLVEK